MRALRTLTSFAFGLPLVLVTVGASAHFALQAPPSTKGDNDGKGAPPCGPDTTDGTATPVTGGSMMPITINETVRHGGFYRVALALKTCRVNVMNQPKCFPDDNTVYDKDGKVLPPTGPGSSDHADFDMNPKFPILADNLFPHVQAGTAEMYKGMIQIPNVNCDRCTLQVIEFMAPHGPNTGGGYFYHHCADLKITADAGKPLFDPANPGGGGTGGGGGLGGGGGTGGATTAGGGAGGASSGTGGVTSGGSGGVATSGSATTAGATTGGIATTTAGSGGTGTVTNPGSGSSSDDGGCGIANRGRGGASLLAALGLAYALVRRRRAR